LAQVGWIRSAQREVKVTVSAEPPAAHPDPRLSGLSFGRTDRLLHVNVTPARAAVAAPWPEWAPSELRDAFARRGIVEPWRHQVVAAEAAHAGRNVVVATGTASGKSLAFLLPALSVAIEGATAPNGRGATVLYLAPTKALARDQLRAVAELEVPGVRPAAYDGDTPNDQRTWIRAHANCVLTNPDLLHFALLPGHARWSAFLRSLRVVVVDECHAYRGVFGSHVANVLRRLNRLATYYGAAPVYVAASATVADPAVATARLIGRPVIAITDDAAPRGPVTVGLWEPPLLPGGGEHGAPIRRSVTIETAELLSDLVISGARTLAFVRSRRGAETVSLVAKERLAEVGKSMPEQVAAYRGGYLPEERRAIEADLKSGRLRGLATTSALELGIDVSGLDAVLVAGWPGTRASLFQQLGRAGRAGQSALGVLIARDDPLDTYLVHHPEAIFGTPIEATVCDPTNPVVLAPHLCAAAAEIPLRANELQDFGPGATELVDELTARGLLRARPDGWYWTRRARATDLADLRGTGGSPVRIVETGTGRLLGLVDTGAAQQTVHTGAIYLHRGETYLVDQLDEAAAVAEAHLVNVDYSTYARSVTDVALVEQLERRDFDGVTLVLGVVDVTTRVVSYLSRRVPSGEVLGEFPLLLPERHLRTRGVWLVVTPSALAEAGITDIPGAAHAAEHATIGLLPLVATCDRWDIGGVSTENHPDTGRCTIVVYDGAAGGAGFAERGYRAAPIWLAATRDTVSACECLTGCPSCIQSPKCGNGNEPLDKEGARRLLDLVVTALLA
jgi:DEAD/DEAH box helicase domain-containing protein